MRASVVLLIVSSVCPSSKYHPTNISTTSYSISSYRSLLDCQRWQKQWNNVRSSASMCYRQQGWHLIHVSGLHQVRLHMLPFYTESYFHYVLPIHTSYEILCLYISSLNRPKFIITSCLPGRQERILEDCVQQSIIHLWVQLLVLSLSLHSQVMSEALSSGTKQSDYSGNHNKQH